MPTKNKWVVLCMYYESCPLLQLSSCVCVCVCVWRVSSFNVCRVGKFEDGLDKDDDVSIFFVLLRWYDPHQSTLHLAVRGQWAPNSVIIGCQHYLSPCVLLDTCQLWWICLFVIIIVLLRMYYLHVLVLLTRAGTTNHMLAFIPTSLHAGGALILYLPVFWRSCLHRSMVVLLVHWRALNTRVVRKHHVWLLACV